MGLRVRPSATCRDPIDKDGTTAKELTVGDVEWDVLHRKTFEEETRKYNKV
jgi:hypothetical protein